MSYAEVEWPDPTSLQAQLVLGPADTVLLFGSSTIRGRCWTDCAVVHRRDGAWTHLYRIEQPVAGGQATVHLRGFWQGEQLARARLRVRALRPPGHSC